MMTCCIVDPWLCDALIYPGRFTTTATSKLPAINRPGSTKCARLLPSEANGGQQRDKGAYSPRTADPSRKTKAIVEFT